MSSSKTRTARRLLAVLSLAVSTVLCVVSPASAATYASGGYVGSYAAPQIDCRHKIWGTTGVLQMTAPAPTVYARNYRAGAGNDGAYVRYAVYFVDARTGAVLNRTGWSGWSYAYDNRPAAFSGAAMYSPDWRGSYVVDYRIEWWAPGGATPLGWVAHRADRYFYVAYNNVAGGVWQTCMKMY
ncbi:hypothetical protein [Terrabacter sp. MAHUQ-38]|jgi:hypothetical protein|uniref:hypothetical protein n=1 Tax=unclassified Terrabacter TaxID=2630222 RepID=UPI00165E2235|nr:hypothetical protein [Terrabacter sp. MAHUQ-38]MBC9820812.1 hypothetical protein [Terrabacter sp. MAHUQ-38]